MNKFTCLGFTLLFGIIMVGCEGLFGGFDRPSGDQVDAIATSDLGTPDNGGSEDGLVQMVDLLGVDMPAQIEDMPTPGVDMPAQIEDMPLPAADLATASDLAKPPADMAASDLAKPPADMATANDLAKEDGPVVVPDLTMPDLTMPDLTMPDLTMPDLTMPDLVKEDMVVSPDLLTSPVSFTMQGTVTNFNGVNVAFATGDFTVDNKQDLVVAARDSGIRILRGVGDGSFVLNPNAYGASQGLRVCVAGNLNGDAKPDLVTTGASGNGTLHTMINDAMMGGQGSFKIANEWSVGGTLPWRLVVNDWNMDGNMDVAVILSGGVVSVLRGDGAGGFAANPVKLTFMNPTNLASADWSGDGLSDLAVLTSKGVELVKGWGNGTFQAPVITTLPGGITPQGLVGGNFDGDTWLDMAVSFGGAGGGVVLLQGAPNGVFTVGGQASVNVSNTVAGLVVGDFNKDKVMDFVVGNVGVQKFTLFLGEGKAKVKPGITFGSGSDPIDLTLGDWNGDGKSDIAILSATQITVALNTTP